MELLEQLGVRFSPVGKGMDAAWLLTNVLNVRAEDRISYLDFVRTCQVLARFRVLVL